MTTSDNEPSILSEDKKEWISLIDESVHTYDDVDIGDVYAISRNFIVVKRGFVNIHYYYQRHYLLISLCTIVKQF